MSWHACSRRFLKSADRAAPADRQLRSAAAAAGSSRDAGRPGDGHFQGDVARAGRSLRHGRGNWPTICANVLEGKPTAARPPTLLDRAGRWVRRRQRTVAVTLATLLIAVVGLSTSVFMVAGAKNRAATHARQFEALYRQAQEMIDELGMQSAEDLRYVPGADQQRQRTLHATIRYLTTLADESKQDKSKQKGHLQKSAAVAYAKIGGLQQQLGLNEQALESYHQAGRILSQLNEQGTFDVDVQRQLALVENSVGLALLRQGKLDDARERFVDVSQRQERLLARTASNLDVQADLAASLCNLGLVQQQLGQSAAAETSFAAATERLKHVAAVLPDGNESKARRAATKEKLAATYGNRAGARFGSAAGASSQLPSSSDRAAAIGRGRRAWQSRFAAQAGQLVR